MITLKNRKQRSFPISLECVCRSSYQDAINEYNNPDLTPEENGFLKSEFQKEYDRNNWSSDEYTHEPGKTYYGNIAEAFGGGGTQLELPISVESLKELGMIHEL